MMGRSHEGRTTKIHGLGDAHCRPVAFLLTGEHAADCMAGDVLLDAIAQTELVNAGKGYGSKSRPNVPRQTSHRSAIRPG